LKKATEDNLVKLVPGLTDDLLKEMQKLFGDGSMSAIDCNLDMERVTGSQGEARCKITLNASGWSTRQSDRFSRRQ
jgi:cyanate lyase